MKVREIISPMPLYEAPTFGQSLLTGAQNLRNYVLPPSATPSSFDKYIKVLKGLTYGAVFVKPLLKYWDNMSQWEEQLKDKPQDLEARRQLERGYLITDLTTILSTISGGEIIISLVSGLCGFIPIIGPLIGALIKSLSPAIIAGFSYWLSSEEGRLATAHLLTFPTYNLDGVQVLQSVGDTGNMIVDMFKKGVNAAYEFAKKEAGQITGTTPPDTKPAVADTPKSADKPATTPENDPWNPKPAGKPKAKPTELKKIEIPTDDVASNPLERVVRGPNGQLQLK